MSKKATWIVIIAAVAAIAFWAFGKYNAMVTAEENVETAWGQVENQYQRRADLIPNLVGVVKQFAKHETEVYEKTMEARAKASSSLSLYYGVLLQSHQRLFLITMFIHQVC